MGRKTCTKCRTEQTGDEFDAHPHTRDGKQSWCKGCVRTDNRERARRTRSAMPKEARSAKHLWERHAMSFEDRHVLWLMQGGRCAVCSSATPGGAGMHIDHDHSCCGPRYSCERCRRGLLCGPCNQGIGLLKERPEVLRAGATYLERY